MYGCEELAFSVVCHTSCLAIKFALATTLSHSDKHPSSKHHKMSACLINLFLEIHTGNDQNPKTYFSIFFYIV